MEFKLLHIQIHASGEIVNDQQGVAVKYFVHQPFVILNVRALLCRLEPLLCQFFIKLEVNVYVNYFISVYEILKQLCDLLVVKFCTVQQCGPALELDDG